MSLQRESSTGSLSTLSEESVHEEDISTKDKPEANKAVTSKPKEVPTFNPREYNMLFFAVSIMKENLEIDEAVFSSLTNIDEDAAKDTWATLRQKVMATAATSMQNAAAVPATNRAAIAGRKGGKVKQTDSKRKRGPESSGDKEETPRPSKKIKMEEGEHEDQVVDVFESIET